MGDNRVSLPARGGSGFYGANNVANHGTQQHNDQGIMGRVRVVMISRLSGQRCPGVGCNVLSKSRMKCYLVKTQRTSSRRSIEPEASQPDLILSRSSRIKRDLCCKKGISGSFCWYYGPRRETYSW